MPLFDTPQLITAIPTPFHQDGSLNLEATKAMLRAVRDSGVNAIFAAGTTGEFAAMSDDERLEILDAALEVFPADAIYFHVGAASAYQAVQLTREAVRRGATRVAAVTPYFQPAPEAAVVDYYRQVVQAAGNAKVWAYLFQDRTTTVSRPELLPQLAAVGVAGVKLSGESDARVQAFLAAAPDGFAVFSGNDTTFGWLIRQGGHGIVSGVSSVYPEPFVALREAFVAGDQAAAADAETQIKQAVAAVKGGSLTHLKAGLIARGIEAGPVRSAVEPASDDDVAHIAELAAQYTR